MPVLSIELGEDTMRFKFSSVYTFFFGFIISTILIDSIKADFRNVPIMLIIGLVLSVIYGFLSDVIWGNK